VIAYRQQRDRQRDDPPVERAGIDRDVVSERFEPEPRSQYVTGLTMTNDNRISIMKFFDRTQLSGILWRERFPNADFLVRETVVIVTSQTNPCRMRIASVAIMVTTESFADQPV